MTASAPEVAPDAASRTGAPGRWRRHRSTLLLVVALLAALALVVLTTGPVTRGADLDPDNPGPDGAQALARVLAQQGVAVEVVRTADALDAVALDTETLVVVTSAGDLGASSSERLLAALAAGGAGAVVVDPPSPVLTGLGVRDDLAPLTSSDDVPAACDDATYDGLRLAVDSADRLPREGCFDGALVGIDTPIGGPGLTVLSAGQALSNDQVLRADNAAVALRLLGARERVVWYVASADDLSADDAVSLTSLAPDWVVPAVGVVFFAVLLLVVWRGRRLGPLAVEPLPVVVKAIEATRSRGRLYRRSGDRAHAAQVLRAAARARIATRLRLGAADGPAVVRATAAHLRRPEPEIAAVLLDRETPPASDHDLIALAHDLTQLEEEVHTA